MTDTQEIDLAPADALQDEELKTFSVAGTEVLLIRRAGRYHAFASRCPHYGAPLEKGHLVGDKLVCPWHHACFRVPSGELCEPPALDHLPSYPVRVDNGRVCVRLPAVLPKVLDSPDKTPTAQTGGVEPLPAGEPAPDNRTFVIVGAGPAGQMAAQTLRTAGFTGRVVLIGAQNQLPYDRTKLTKAYLAGKADDTSLPLRQHGFYERYQVEMRRSTRVVGLDVSQRQLQLDGGNGSLTYDALLLCPGSTPRALPVSLPGHDLPGVFLLRSRSDAHRLRNAAQGARHVVVIGSSFIGMEAAASLADTPERQVTVVGKEKEPLQKVLGAEIGAMFRRLHEEKGVRFLGGTQPKELQANEQGRVGAVVLENGETLPADLVVLGIGVQPATGFLGGALPLENDGGLRVSQELQVAEGIWAAGDVARFALVPDGPAVRIEHWRVAQQQGRTAALNMLGQQTTFRSVPFFWTQQYGKSLRYVGHAERWNELITHGNVAQQDFLTLYVHENRIQAAAGMNRDTDLICIEALMEHDQMPPPEVVRAGADWSALLKRVTAERK
ncbi:FAD-dependent oxidoreductase [Hymenobacter koreensis]|uniref:FAD-dependent oxidoreductase n=1 Tax=Hymenobacter koreensis TaxID=1084523 RepID=A0ABP8IYM7_9BACT